jgi:hypothetical protein
MELFDTSVVGELDFFEQQSTASATVWNLTQENSEFDLFSQLHDKEPPDPGHASVSPHEIELPPQLNSDIGIYSDVMMFDYPELPVSTPKIMITNGSLWKEFYGYPNEMIISPTKG